MSHNALISLMTSRMLLAFLWRRVMAHGHGWALHMGGMPTEITFTVDHLEHFGTGFPQVWNIQRVFRVTGVTARAALLSQISPYDVIKPCKTS